jgi:hypothetical protein
MTRTTLLLLTMLIRITTQATQTDSDMDNGKEINNFSFIAYDCGQPTNIANFAVDKKVCPPEADPTPHTTGVFSLAQKQTRMIARGHKCKRVISRFTVVCSSNLIASHQRLATIPEIEIPESVPLIECRELIKKGFFHGPDGKDHEVKVGATTVFNFHTAGREEVSGSTIVCQGEDVKLGENVIQGVAILEQVKISIYEVTMRFSMLGQQEVAEVKEDHVSIACNSYEHGCVLDDRTYIWGTAKATSFQRVNSFSAEIFKDQDQDVLISQEQKIRLVLGSSLTLHGRVYRATKFAEIYVIPGKADYLDNMPADHLKLTAWVAARDDYLAWALEQQIIRVALDIQQTSCTRTQDLARTQLALAINSGGGFHNLLLGKNQYGTLWGETIFTFQCEAITVKPRRSTVCTKELAVITSDGAPRYMQPVTRVLSDHPTVAPCSALMPAKYETDQGVWIAATPALSVVAAPSVPANSNHLFEVNHTDMSTGGLYTTEQLTKFGQLLNYPKITAAVTDSVLHQICVDNQHTLCQDLRQGLGEGHPLAMSPIFNFRHRFITFLHNFGEAAAILVALYTIGSAAIWISSTIFNCFQLRHLAGARKWLQPFCPLLHITRDYGRTARMAAQRRREEEAAQEEEERDAQIIQELQEDDARGGFEEVV